MPAKPADLCTHCKDAWHTTAEHEAEYWSPWIRSVVASARRWAGRWKDLATLYRRKVKRVLRENHALGKQVADLTQENARLRADVPVELAQWRADAIRALEEVRVLRAREAEAAARCLEHAKVAYAEGIEAAAQRLIDAEMDHAEAYAGEIRSLPLRPGTPPTALQEIEDLRRLLASVEWAGDFCDEPACPVCLCRQWKGHRGDCALKAAIREGV